jgi:hypothetical protein
VQLLTDGHGGYGERGDDSSVREAAEHDSPPAPDRDERSLKDIDELGRRAEAIASIARDHASVRGPPDTHATGRPHTASEREVPQTVTAELGYPAQAARGARAAQAIGDGQRRPAQLAARPARAQPSGRQRLGLLIPSFNGPTPSSLSTVVAALAVPENPPPGSMLATTASPRKRSPGRMDGTYLPSRLRA